MIEDQEQLNLLFGLIVVNNHNNNLIIIKEVVIIAHGDVKELFNHLLGPEVKIISRVYIQIKLIIIEACQQIQEMEFSSLQSNKSKIHLFIFRLIKISKK